MQSTNRIQSIDSESGPICPLQVSEVTDEFLLILDRSSYMSGPSWAQVQTVVAIITELVKDNPRIRTKVRARVKNEDELMTINAPSPPRSWSTMTKHSSSSPLATALPSRLKPWGNFIWLCEVNSEILQKSKSSVPVEPPTWWRPSTSWRAT